MQGITYNADLGAAVFSNNRFKGQNKRKVRHAENDFLLHRSYAPSADGSLGSAGYCDG
jgi:hypothetical protein